MTKLYRYQRIGIRKIEKAAGISLLADDVGLGKTIQILRWFKDFCEPDDELLVICPKAVKYHWEAEARRHCNIRCTILEHIRPPKHVATAPGTRIWIGTYKTIGSPKDQGRTWLKFFRKRRQVKVIAVDEGQYIKSRYSQRSRAVHQLKKKRHRIVATGTPLLNNPAELFSILNFLWPKKFKSFFAFAYRYTKPRRRFWGWEFKGARNLDKLNRKLVRLGMIRRLKQDVLKDLPKKSRHILLLPIDNMKEYKEATENFISWLMKLDKRKALTAMRTQELTKITYLIGLICKLKRKSIIEWIEDFLEDSNRKLVVFGTRNRDLLIPLHERFEDQSVLVTGAVTGQKREHRVERFQTDKRIRIFFANIWAAGVGMDGLQKASDTMLFANFAWRPADHSQAEGRLDRLGQKFPVSVYYGVAKGTFEEDLLAIIQNKQSDLDQVLDGAKKGSSTLNVFDQFLRHLIHKEKSNGRLLRQRPSTAR